MLALDDPEIFGIALSGAGPSVIALIRPGCRVGERLTAIFARHGVTSRSFELALAEKGIVREG
jgi:homoserine kinase